MRKRLCALMMTLILLLSACGNMGGSGAEKLLQQVRGSYLEMAGCIGHGEIVADYGQRVYSFGVDFSWEKEGETLLRLTYPENVVGTTAHINKGETALEFDGVIVETGPLDEAGLTPIDVIPALLHNIREGYIADCALEEREGLQELHAICRDPEKVPGEGVEVQLWFDPETLGLLRGEVSSDGVTVIRCEITEFSMTSPERTDDIDNASPEE